MKGRNRRTGMFVSLLLTLTVLVSACTNRDEMFGNDMVPPSQQMGSAIDSTVAVFTYASTCDSLDTNIAGFYQPFMGSYIDPVVGRTDIQIFANFSPYGFEHTHYFGENPVIDSMRYTFSFVNAMGDTTKPMTIDVYEVKEGIIFNQDSAYFSNFDMSPYIDEGNPLFSFEHKGIGMVYGKLPQEFAERLLDNTQDQTNIYYNDTTFHKKFPGLYFKIRDAVTSGQGQMLQLDLAESGLTLFYHNTGPDEPDTTFQRMLFYGDYTYDYISFTTIQHNYTLSNTATGGIDPSLIVERENINKETPKTEYLYVQGLAGLMGLMQVDTLGIQALKQKALDLGYTHVALHRAELQLTMVDADVEQYDLSFSSLGIYHNMLEYDFLDEYNPVLDAVTNSGYSSWLGGSLNRSRGIYTFDVTSYIQSLITEKEDRYTTELLPSYALRNYFYRSWIYGYNSPYPPRLILTYTMIK
ncbi:MAG TPA: DUF4270 domain-containing protein [Candidatus Rikenella faecigallinarum]|uniref:DUF4270 domain-containing protein n=1 Tax=Candidatus Rikenella faecigallinarum TaxID=2838745 RepID=A0A9D1QCT7_9BACT|nr:DUF4270 domain-containing protein [Candidatus Rikenella faecigallinarum]